MTVCVAGIAGDRSAIIGITDRAVGAGVLSADIPNLWKTARLHPSWFAMFAGNDVQYAPPVFRRARATLHGQEFLSVREVASVFVEAYADERIRIVEQTILNPLGLSLSDYKAMLSTGEGDSITQQIKRLEFDCQFLVSGFDGAGLPHVFTVMPPGVEGHYDSIGFWAIGSGSESALSQLFFRKFNPAISVGEATYLIGEAKFMAESAMGVGQQSAMWILNREGEWAFIRGRKMRQLRTIWTREGQPPIPDNIDERMLEEIVFIKVPPMREVEPPKQLNPASDDNEFEGEN